MDLFSAEFRNILPLIIAHLPRADAIALAQTCRGIHAICAAHYKQRLGFFAIIPRHLRIRIFDMLPQRDQVHVSRTNQQMYDVCQNLSYVCSRRPHSFAGIHICINGDHVRCLARHKKFLNNDEAYSALTAACKIKSRVFAKCAVLSGATFCRECGNAWHHCKTIRTIENWRDLRPDN